MHERLKTFRPCPQKLRRLDDWFRATVIPSVRADGLLASAGMGSQLKNTLAKLKVAQTVATEARNGFLRHRKEHGC
jgi:hypothetical protein